MLNAISKHFPAGIAGWGYVLMLGVGLTSLSEGRFDVLVMFLLFTIPVGLVVNLFRSLIDRMRYAR